MTDMSKGLRETLSQAFAFELPQIRTTKISQDGTIKFLLGLSDGQLIETVLIPNEDRYTQCLSTQVGCPMACTFCSTGTMGFVRQMTAGEIAGQVLVARRHLEEKNPHEILQNLVFMGMGEPLLNWTNVQAALAVLNHPLGLDFSSRRITLSTVGRVKELVELGSLGLTSLAISLHAPTQELRRQIMPRAAELPLADLISCLETYPLKARQQITIEYLMLGGVNDSQEHARELVRLLSRVKCKINLIAFNPSPNLPFAPPDPQAVLDFQKILWSKGLTVILRKSKGQDIAAACGQLVTQCREERSNNNPDC